ncbi:MAG: hypothetical protein H6Q16_1094 [Bacteroidetes bacterium]|nr:hypothetical protein [Bacteroidota bacterium]
MVCSFTSLISQNSILIKGIYKLELKNNIFYSEYINDDSGEFLEQRLIMMNLDTKRKDTLIYNTFYIDVCNYSDNEIVMTDGNIVSVYNIDSKEKTNIYSQFDEDMAILDVITNEKDIYFFVQDYNNYKVLFYKILSNNMVSLLHSFKYAELESPGLLTFGDKDYFYILVNGDIYSYNLKTKKVNKLTNEYVDTFNLTKDRIYYLSIAEYKESLKSISLDNLKVDIIIKDIQYYHPDRFFKFNNTLYIHNSIGKQSYKIINQELVPITKIPLISNDQYTISFINNDYFEITW